MYSIKRLTSKREEDIKKLTSPLNTPVLFLIFNRPDTTWKVFEVIRRVKPQKLFVAADGPRTEEPDEVKKCLEAREIATEIDWDCELKTLFRNQNLGCKVAVSSAIAWFFDHVEEGIILEDDCLPHPTFFRFCEELLARYKNDTRIMTISGDNFQFGKQRIRNSYYFSRYPHVWGWATWRRTWQKYDAGIKLWPTIQNGGWLRDILQNRKTEEYWYDIFDNVYNNIYDTWDYQLVFSCLINNGLNIVSNINLITNIGFGCNATHTIKKNKLSEIPFAKMNFPLVHPRLIIRDSLADEVIEKEHFNKLSIITRIKNKIWNIVACKIRYVALQLLYLPVILY